MTALFYLIGLLAIGWEALTLSNLEVVHKFMNRMHATKAASYDTTQTIACLLHGGYCVWIIVGIFTFNWPIFLLLLAFGFVNKRDSMNVRAADSALSLILLSLIYLNKFYFHIHLASLL